MKKIISALLILTMLFSVVSISTSAAGIIINQNFSTMEELTSQFVAGAFYVAPEGGLLYGYSEARVLQSLYDDTPGWMDPDNLVYTWVEYDTTVELAIGPDDLNPQDRYINLTYCNDNPMYQGRLDSRQMLSFTYDVQLRQFVLGDGWDVTDPEQMLMPAVPYEIDTEGTTFFTLGLSVEKDRIRCFYNNEVIFDFQDTAREWLIADYISSPFLIWNTGNFVQVKNVTVADQGYLFPDIAPTESTTAEPTPTETTTTQGGDDPVPTETTTQGGDDPAPTGTTTGKVEGPADSNDDPANTNKAPDNNAPANTNNNAGNNAPADTNTNKPTGGSSTATGDATFVVVAAMVATLGCALIVKKVSAK